VVAQREFNNAFGGCQGPTVTVQCADTFFFAPVAHVLGEDLIPGGATFLFHMDPYAAPPFPVNLFYFCRASGFHQAKRRRARGCDHEKAVDQTQAKTYLPEEGALISRCAKT
jgi:hypothetical protein